jgi:hypothetical protein
MHLLLSLLLACYDIHPIRAEESVQVDGQRAAEESDDIKKENDDLEPPLAPAPMRVLGKRIVQLTPKPPEDEQQDEARENAAAAAEDHARMQKAAEDELAKKKHHQQHIVVGAEEHVAATARPQHQLIEHGQQQQEIKEDAHQEQPFVEEDHEIDVTHLENASSSHPDHKRALWGGATVHDEEKGANPDEEEKQQQHDLTPPSLQPQPQQKSIPFMPKHPVSTTASALPSSSSTVSSLHSPPKGYVITARVYIDPADKLAHLDQNHITLPYWDCGVTGSTTSPLAIKEATFRHSLSPSTPSSWSGTDGKHALLAVALSPLILDVSCGDSLTIQPGQVVLLEDVLVPGHKFRPINHHQDLQVLFLTLPQPHYHTGKDHVSLHASAAKTKMEHPCPITESGDELMGVGTLSSSKVSLFHGKRVRRWLFGLVGLSLSTLVADFLGKTAPLWLAAGIGGTCFVVAGTTLSVLLGETSWINLEAWYQQRRLRPTRSSSSSSASPATEPLEKKQQEWQHQQQHQHQHQTQPIKTAFQPRHEEAEEEEEET